MKKGETTGVTQSCVFKLSRSTVPNYEPALGAMSDTTLFGTKETLRRWSDRTETRDRCDEGKTLKVDQNSGETQRQGSRRFTRIPANGEF